MDSAVFDQLENSLRSEGPDRAIEQLCENLREEKSFHSLFYALLLKKRQELGISPIPTGPAQDLPESIQEAYEDGVREAARHVGSLLLAEGNIPQAWMFFRILEEPEPVREALEKYQPDEEEDLQELVQLAFYEGVHPKKGFDLILEHFGLCSAITTLGGQEMPYPEDVRQYCLRSVIRALYEELCERIAGEIEREEGKVPPAFSLPVTKPGQLRELLGGRFWLFAEEDCYHVDISHLSSVVQMSIHLQPCMEIELARELCLYGEKLSDRLKHPGDPPFEDQYKSFGMYLSVLAGDNVEAGLDFFREEAARADPDEVGTFPAEVMVNLLLKVNRNQEAVEVARKYLSDTEGRPLTCPGLPDLCQKVNDYRTLAEVAREQGDAVFFLAGLLALEGCGR